MAACGMNDAFGSEASVKAAVGSEHLQKTTFALPTAKKPSLRHGHTKEVERSAPSNMGPRTEGEKPSNSWALVQKINATGWSINQWLRMQGRRKPTWHRVEENDARAHSVVVPSTGMADDGQRPMQVIVDGDEEVVTCKNVHTLLTTHGKL